ncbi:hypothetical protein POM88_016484 [Heracleum sosnowskyi]|uniref:TF-B3 domain-containing protein n=1 Tax=Heracleum sosnowskyi TaxID=360622 RepID=A0AAD8MWY7_9APIA|nr:hypothetical protein POM88_016484 [Heracleum sosnowskyi]
MLYTVWRKEQYVIDEWSLEYDKSHALWSFCSHHNYVNYFEKKIKFFDIDENVYLTFVERSWEIGIEWVAGKCYFGKGWSEFVTETELDVGDSLLLFKEPLSRYDNINVYIFKGKDNVIDMSQGSKECSASFYKVLSEFSINDSVLDDFCEVDYFEFRTIPTGTSNNQDNINGVGWKFLIRASRNAIEYGEIEIPRRFVRRFGKGIPGTVSFGLRNDKNFTGQYLHNERKMLGLVEIIMYTHLEEEELCLFTYCGDGKFEIVVFDISKVEMDDPVLTFSALMTLSNINNTSHGTYITGYIKPGNHNFEHGERVTFRCENGEWEVAIVFSNGIPRFSTGWNQFAKYNKLSLNETIEFTMVEEEDGLAFEIGFPGRD